MPQSDRRAPVRRWESGAARVEALLVLGGAVAFSVAAGWMILTWGHASPPGTINAAARRLPPVQVPAVALPGEQKPARLFTGADPFGSGSFQEPGRGPRTAGARLALVDVRGHDNRERAVLGSGERRYVVLEGNSFAGSFTLIDAWGPCATLWHEGRVTLCQGDSIPR